MILYKYCDEKGIDLLKNTRIKLSNLFDINDPFEFLPQRAESERFQKALEALYEYQGKNYRILSFSKDSCNLIMWGHYGNNHKGILYKIDTKKIYEEIDGENPFQEVRYSKKRPSIDLKELINGNERVLYTSLQSLVYTKYEGWSYEKEVRAIVKHDPSDDEYFKISAKSIIEVILGMNASQELELSVQKILRQPEFKHIKLKKAKPDERKYSLHYEEIEI